MGKIIRLVRWLGRVRKIEPKDIHVAILGQKFCDLVADVGGVAGLTAPFIESGSFFIGSSAIGADSVIENIIGMVPIEERIIEADPQAAPAEGLDEGFEEVATGGSVGRFVVGVLGIPQTEPLVVLGGDHEIFHSGVCRGFGPGIGIVKVGVEAAEVASFVFFDGDFFIIHQPFVAGAERVETPMDEEAEPVVCKPARVAPLEIKGEFIAGRVLFGVRHDCFWVAS